MTIMIVIQTKYNKKTYNFKKHIKVENEHQTTTVNAQHCIETVIDNTLLVLFIHIKVFMLCKI